MDSFDLHTRWRITLYITLWGVVSTIFACIMSPLVRLPFSILWVSGGVFGGWIAILVPFLWNVIKYGNLLALNSILKVIVFLALGLLTVGVWLGVSLLSLYWILTDEMFSLFLPIIPLFGLIGMLLFIIVVQAASFSYLQQMDIGNENYEDALTTIPSLSDEQKEITTFIDRVAVKIGSTVRVIPADDILYLQSEGDYVLIITDKGKFIKEQTMKYFAQKLPQKQFVRIHRSFIVNVSSISRIECYGKNKQSMTLRNGVQLKMSSPGYRLLKASLNL
jgi:hypothetical protein